MICILSFEGPEAKFSLHILVIILDSKLYLGDCQVYLKIFFKYYNSMKRW